jgi:hypothetical protein
MPARNMKAYMKEYRKGLRAQGLNSNGKPYKQPKARRKAERAAGSVRADAALPRDAISRASKDEITVVKADIAAIQNEGGSAVVTQVGGRLRAVDAAPRPQPAERNDPPTKPEALRSLLTLSPLPAVYRPPTSSSSARTERSADSSQSGSPPLRPQRRLDPCSRQAERRPVRRSAPSSPK